MIGEQHGMVLGGHFADRAGQVDIARRVIGDQRQVADPHDVIGGDRRQHIGRVDIGQAADRHGMGGVQMDHRAGLRPLAIHGQMQHAFLGRRVAGDKSAGVIQFRQPGRVEGAQGGAGRRHQPAVIDAHTDIA